MILRSALSERTAWGRIFMGNTRRLLVASMIVSSRRLSTSTAWSSTGQETQTVRVRSVCSAKLTITQSYHVLQEPPPKEVHLLVRSPEQQPQSPAQTTTVTQWHKDMQHKHTKKVSFWYVSDLQKYIYCYFS